MSAFIDGDKIVCNFVLLTAHVGEHATGSTYRVTIDRITGQASSVAETRRDGGVKRSLPRSDNWYDAISERGVLEAEEVFGVPLGLEPRLAALSAHLAEAVELLKGIAEHTEDSLTRGAARAFLEKHGRSEGE